MNPNEAVGKMEWPLEIPSWLKAMLRRKTILRGLKSKSH